MSFQLWIWHKPEKLCIDLSSGGDCKSVVAIKGSSKREPSVLLGQCRTKYNITVTCTSYKFFRLSPQNIWYIWKVFKSVCSDIITPHISEQISHNDGENNEITLSFILQCYTKLCSNTFNLDISNINNKLNYKVSEHTYIVYTKYLCKDTNIGPIRK